jgi:hypothetical protein
MRVLERADGRRERERRAAMAIDGRTIMQQPKDAHEAAYESRGLHLVAHLIVWVPLLLFLWFTYWSGTFFGGAWGGIASVVSTAAGIVGWYFWKRMRR